MQELVFLGGNNVSISMQHLERGFEKGEVTGWNVEGADESFRSLVLQSSSPGSSWAFCPLDSVIHSKQVS